MREEVCQRVGRLALDSATTVLGMKPKALVRELKADKTLTQVAREKGMAVDKFKAALLQDVQRDLNALVAEGKLTETQADGIYSRTLPPRVRRAL